MLSGCARKLALIAVVVAALFGAMPLFSQTGGLTGKATLADGSPCVKCIIVIDSLETKAHYTVKTGKKGDYVYVGLQIGDYKVTLQDQTGVTLFFFPRTHVTYNEFKEVIFDLAKEKAAAKKQLESNPEFQKILEQRAKEEKQTGDLKTIFEEGNALMAAAQGLSAAPSDPPEKRQQVEQQRREKYEEAAAKFEQGLPLAKGQNEVIIVQAAGNAYRQARQYDKALQYYQKAIQLNPSEAAFHNSLGNLYADTRKIPEAVQEFQKAAELNPLGASHEYFNLGVIMYNQGNMNEAVKALQKATDLDPNYAEAFYWQGLALMGKMTLGPDNKPIPAPGTVEALQTYLKLEPNGKWAQAAKDSLQMLQGSVQTEYKASKKKRK